MPHHSRYSSFLLALAILALAAMPAFAQSSPYEGIDVPKKMDPRMLPHFQKSAHDCTASADNRVSNCSFETGDFTGWITQDLAEPLFPISVVPDGFSDFFFPVTATQGNLVATHGYDGGGPGNIIIAQDVTVTGADCELEFDYRGAWDMGFFGATLPRELNVRIEQPVGNTVFAENIITSPAGSTADTGLQSANVSIPFGATSAGAARLVFDSVIPEDFTGPAQLMLDNVDLQCATPQGLIEELIAFVESLGIQGGVENALVKKLENAIKDLDSDDVADALDKLGAFRNQVEAQAGKKISDADAQEMIDQVDVIIGLLS